MVLHIANFGEKKNASISAFTHGSLKFKKRNRSAHLSKISQKHKMRKNKNRKITRRIVQWSFTFKTQSSFSKDFSCDRSNVTVRVKSNG